MDDEVVILGHRTDPKYQSAVLIAASGDNTPYLAHYSGINEFNLEDKEVLREGNLSGIMDPDFEGVNFQNKFGLYSSSAYLKGDFMVKTESGEYKSVAKITPEDINFELT